MEELKKRQVAYKLRINDILSGEYKKEEGWSPNFIHMPDGRQVSRINLIATVVAKDDETDNNSQSFILDDGTGRLEVRDFEDNPNIKNLNIGDIILLIGRPREYGNERYIIPEIIKKVEEKRWILLRKMELDKISRNENVIQKTKEKISEIDDDKKDESGKTKDGDEEKENSYEEVLEYMRKKDRGDGVGQKDITGFADKNIIEDMLKDGEIFEIKPGRYKVLE